MIVKRKFRYTLDKGKFMNMIHRDKCKVKYMPQVKLTWQKLEQNYRHINSAIPYLIKNLKHPSNKITLRTIYLLESVYTTQWMNS